MLHFCDAKWKVSLQNFDYCSWLALGRWSVTGLIKVGIVPRVLTFLHAWLCSAAFLTPLTSQMFFSSDKSAMEHFLQWLACLPLYCGHTHSHKDFIRHASRTIHFQLSANVDIIQVIFTSWIPASPFFHLAIFCLSVRAAQLLPEMAIVTITSATIMIIEYREMLAMRQTAFRHDSLIRLHNVASAHPASLGQTRQRRRQDAECQIC